VFIMAKSYLQTEFGFMISSEGGIDLVYEDQLLPRGGVLGDVPVLEQAVIVIIFSRIAGTSPPKVVSPPKKSSPVPAYHDERSYHGRSQEPNQQRDTSQGRHGRDSRDRLESGRHGIRDYCGTSPFGSLTMCYVLDPEFFDHLPLTMNQRRDNKLVYYLIEDAVQGSPLASSYVRQISTGEQWF
jgi:hypothetical protein